MYQFYRLLLRTTLDFVGHLCCDHLLIFKFLLLPIFPLSSTFKIAILFLSSLNYHSNSVKAFEVLCSTNIVDAVFEVLTFNIFIAVQF